MGKITVLGWFISSLPANSNIKMFMDSNILVNSLLFYARLEIRLQGLLLSDILIVNFTQITLISCLIRDSL